MLFRALAISVWTQLNSTHTKWDCDLYWMGHVCILAAKYWKPPGVEEPWFLWETYSALHCTLGDVSFSVFESALMYLCIWVPNPPLILHLSLLLLKKVWNIIFNISLQRSLRLFFRGNNEHTNPFISSQGWCVPVHPVAPHWIILKMYPAAESAVQPHQGCAEWGEKLPSHSALLELQHQFWATIRQVEIYHL